MRIFKLELRGQGGRFLNGRCSTDFAEYWDGKDPVDQVQHIFKVNVSKNFGDQNSPAIREDGETSIYNCNELEDFLCVKETNGYRVTEVTTPYTSGLSQAELDTDTIKQIQKNTHSEDPNVAEHWFDGNKRHERNIMFSGRKGQHDATIAMFNWLDGNFGTTYIITEHDFKPDLITAGVVVTDMGELVTDVWYDGHHLPFVVDEDISSHDNGLYISIGYSDLTEYQESFKI